MGVLGLWKIIERAGIENNDQNASSYGSPLVSLSPLFTSALTDDSSSIPTFTGKVLAVDLSVWIAEAQALQKTIASQSAANASAGSYYVRPKPHVLYIFRRICSFLKHNIRLIFVTDGRAPEIKTRLGLKENQLRTEAKSRGITAFKGQVRDCIELLRLLDIPLLTLQQGEAEACCAQLNQMGIVDGVITTDGDAFLFGARCVLRNLEASQTALAAKVVRMSSIETHTDLKLDRAALVILALIQGSDYTSGVRSIGPRKAVKFVQILAGCVTKFQAAEAICRTARPPIIEFFRTLIQCNSPPDAIQMVLKYHDARLPTSSSSSSASSPSSPSALVEAYYSSLTLAELKQEMDKHGLKPQTKAIMVAKLTQIASQSDFSNILPQSFSLSNNSGAILISDSDSDSEEDFDELDPGFYDHDEEEKSSRPKAKPKRKVAARKKKKSKSSKASVSLFTFLTKYLTKIHDRYHEPANVQEMDSAIQAYLNPTIKPSVQDLAKNIKNRIPVVEELLQLRALFANELHISAIKFEKMWLPVYLHIQLWKAEEALVTNLKSKNNSSPDIADQCSDNGSEIDLVSSPPVASPPISSSPATVLPPLYVPSHISKRRIVRGVPSAVLIWKKTTRGQKEVATLPQPSDEIPSSQLSNHPENSELQIAESDDDDEHDSVPDENIIDEDDECEVDLTAPSSSITSSPAAAAAAAAASASTFPNSQASTSAVTRAAKKKPTVIQDVDINFYETVEPLAFLSLSVPQLIAQLEQEEQQRVEAKLAARAAAALAKKEAASERAKQKGARKGKNNVIDKTNQSIKSFLSPVISFPSAKIRAGDTNQRASADDTSIAVNDDADQENESQASNQSPVPLKSPATNVTVKTALGSTKLPYRQTKLLTSMFSPTTEEIPLNNSPVIVAQSSSPHSTSKKSSHSANRKQIGNNKSSPLISSGQSTIFNFVKSAKLVQKTNLLSNDRKIVEKMEPPTLELHPHDSIASLFASSTASISSSKIMTTKVAVESKNEMIILSDSPDQADNLSDIDLTMSPPVIAAAATVHAHAPSRISSMDAAAVSTSVASLSASLEMCPLCSRAFPMHVLSEHVNACLDQNQMQQDEVLAKKVGAAPKHTPAADVVVSSDSDSDFDLDSEVHQELVLVPNSSSKAAAKKPIATFGSNTVSSSPIHGSVQPPKAASKTSTCKGSPLTPQKRKKLKSPNSDSNSEDGKEKVSMQPTSSVQVANRKCQRSLCLDSDDEGMDEREAVNRKADEPIVIDDDEEDEPGSTVYFKKK